MFILWDKQEAVPRIFRSQRKAIGFARGDSIRYDLFQNSRELLKGKKIPLTMGEVVDNVGETLEEGDAAQRSTRN